MKIEFIKEKNKDGRDIFFTEVDGCYIEDSLEYSEEKAYRTYLYEVTKRTIPNYTDRVTLESREV